MNDELDELYQELILEHGMHPHHFGDLPSATHQGKGLNPVCSDEIIVYLKIEDKKIVDIRFQGAGCVLSQASASMMTDLIKGKSLAEFDSLFSEFRNLLTQEKPEKNSRLKDLMAFEGVKNFPMRVKCVTLAWHAVRSAVYKTEET